MRVISKKFFYSAATLVAIATSTFAYAQVTSLSLNDLDQIKAATEGAKQDQATEKKYVKKTATVTIKYDKREDLLQAFTEQSPNGKSQPAYSRTGSKVVGTLNIDIEDSLNLVSQAYSPNLKKNNLTVSMTSDPNKMIAHTTPGSKDGDVQMIKDSAGCFAYESKVRDQMIAAENDDLKAQVPGILSRAIQSRDAAEYIGLEPNTVPEVAHIDNSRSNTDECLFFDKNDAKKAYLFHEPRTVRVVIEMSVLDKGALPKFDPSEEPKPLKSNFDVRSHQPIKN